MSWKILVSAPYMQPVIQQYISMLEEPGEPVELVIPPVRERLSEKELLEWITDIDGVICGDDEFTDVVMKAGPNLKVISKWGTGIDSINQDAAAEMGIAVCNTPDAFTDPVADTVLGYMLCFSRQLPWMDQEIRSGNWGKSPGFALHESTLGVVGFGNVGKAIVRRATAFGMRVLTNDVIQIPSETLIAMGIEQVSKTELLKQSDFVSLNCDLNPTSHHFIGESELELMRPTAYLINTARGPLVDEQALAHALRDGGIAGAALDVFEVEPLPPESELRKMNNCLFAPHNANSSPEAYLRVHENTIRNLLLHLKQATR